MGLFNKFDDFCDNISVQGYSHIKVNKECQDNSISWKEKNYCGIIVCDGHGGEKYIRSAVGSRLACEVGKEYISAFMEKFLPENPKQIDTSLEQLERAIVSGWYSAVKRDFDVAPVTEDERFEGLEDSDKNALIKNPVKAYGSTFIAAVKTDDYLFVLKLGDGNTVLIYSDGTSEMPEDLEDEDCQFNITTSLCNNDAAMSFHHLFKTLDDENNIAGITLTSDGVINCYKTEESFLSFMENVYFGYGEDGPETAKQELIPALDNLSMRGSGDDLSVAIIRVPFTKAEKELIEKKKEKEEKDRLLREAEQARIAEEKARLEKEKAEKEMEELRLKAEKEEAERKRLQAELEKLNAEKLKEQEEAKNQKESTVSLPKPNDNTISDVEVFVVKESTVTPAFIVEAKEIGQRMIDQAKERFNSIIEIFNDKNS